MNEVKEGEESDNARQLLCMEGLSLRSKKRHRKGGLGRIRGEKWKRWLWWKLRTERHRSCSGGAHRQVGGHSG